MNDTVINRGTAVTIGLVLSVCAALTSATWFIANDRAEMRAALTQNTVDIARAFLVIEGMQSQLTQIHGTLTRIETALDRALLQRSAKDQGDVRP